MTNKIKSFIGTWVLLLVITAGLIISCSGQSFPTAQSEPVSHSSGEIVENIAATPNGELFLPPRGDVRVVMLSDFNSAYGSVTYDPEVHKAVKLLPFWQPDLVLSAGDMVAGQNLDLSEAQVKAMWAAFDAQIAQPIRQQGYPLGITLGNHDASSAMRNQRYVFANERQQAAEYWQSPAHDPGVTFIDKTHFPFYYTFQQGGIFFLAWDASSHHIPPEKLAWVEQALSSPAAQSAKLRILLGHLPLYAIATGRDRPGEVLKNADALRRLLEKSKVHTYISGHHHAYYPAVKGNLNLLYTGAIGSGPRSLLDDSAPRRKTLTVMDITFGESNAINYTTYDMQTLAVIENKGLPRYLLGHNGRVIRRDIIANLLTPEEKAECLTRLGAALCKP